MPLTVVMLDTESMGQLFFPTDVGTDVGTATISYLLVMNSGTADKWIFM